MQKEVCGADECPPDEPTGQLDQRRRLTPAIRLTGRSDMAFEVVLALAVVFAAVRSSRSPVGARPSDWRRRSSSAGSWPTLAYHLAFGPSGFEQVDPVHLVLDGGELVAIVWLALRANRMWPLWAAAAQLICVSGHLALFVAPGMRGPTGR